VRVVAGDLVFAVEENDFGRKVAAGAASSSRLRAFLVHWLLLSSGLIPSASRGGGFAGPSADVHYAILA
jgi:hypothetical protein